MVIDHIRSRISTLAIQRSLAKEPDPRQVTTQLRRVPREHTEAFRRAIDYLVALGAPSVAPLIEELHFSDPSSDSESNVSDKGLDITQIMEALDQLHSSSPVAVAEPVWNRRGLVLEMLQGCQNEDTVWLISRKLGSELKRDSEILRVLINRSQSSPTTLKRICTDLGTQVWARRDSVIEILSVLGGDGGFVSGVFRNRLSADLKSDPEIVQLFARSALYEDLEQELLENYDAWAGIDESLDVASRRVSRRVVHSCEREVCIGTKTVSEEVGGRWVGPYSGYGGGERYWEEEYADREIPIYETEYVDCETMARNLSRFDESFRERVIRQLPQALTRKIEGVLEGARG